VQTRSPGQECKKINDQYDYIQRERADALYKTATCTEHGAFSDIHWSDAAPYRRFAEFRDCETGVDNLMPPPDMLNIWGRAYGSQ